MTSNDPEHWRLRLLELIACLGVSQRKFSDDTGIDPTYVSRLLYPPDKKGGKRLGLANMSAIKDAYKLSAGWFELPLGVELPEGPPGDDEAGAATRLKEIDPEFTYKKRRIEQALKLMEHMEPYQLDQAVKIIDTLAEPHKDKRGNGK